MGNQLYGYTADEHEFSVKVPEMISGDPDIVIYISAHGGGTLGESYSDNGWDYMITADGATIVEGSDVRSGGIGATHEQTARTLANFLSTYGEHFAGKCDHFSCEYRGAYAHEETTWLASEYERLGMFASELDSREHVTNHGTAHYRED